MKTNRILVASVSAVLVLTALAVWSYGRPKSSSSFSTVTDPQFGTVIRDQLIIVFRSSTTPAQVNDLLTAAHVDVIKSVPEVRMWAVRVPGSTGIKDLKRAMELIGRYPQVESVQPNQVATLD